MTPPPCPHSHPIPQAVHRAAGLYGVLDTHGRPIGAAQRAAAFYRCGSAAGLARFLRASLLALPGAGASEWAGLGAYAQFQLVPLIPLAPLRVNQHAQPPALSPPPLSETPVGTGTSGRLGFDDAAAAAAGADSAAAFSRPCGGGPAPPASESQADAGGSESGFGFGAAAAVEAERALLREQARRALQCKAAGDAV
jgi:hypothetical protein